ncbi:MAG: magnesium-translocating P-type ATPase [Pseudomonadota bacterium]|nr:magnesium-translocating P-type ATPase [Pseudomonadota bacterium]
MMSAFWGLDPETVLTQQRSTRAGLDPEEAARRLVELGATARMGHRRRGVLRILAAQFFNPLVLLLLVAAVLSVPVGSLEDSIVILAIVALSGGLGFVQEYAAEDAISRLLARTRVRATVRRGTAAVEVPLEEIVPGDVVVLSAGATVPGDGRLVEVNGLQVDESALTGESFPASKRVEAVAEDAPVARRRSGVFLGTHVVSGTGDAVIVSVGRNTELGHISTRLLERRPPTDFDLGLHRFGALLVRVSAVLVLVIFAINVVLERPPTESFLFSVALAVGLVPELLPAIVTVNLARGARRMADVDVVVKRLASIEDLGAVDVLCSDKTGTLTQGRIRLVEAYGADGRPSLHARELGWLNATLESGYANPIDAALREGHVGDASAWKRVGEIPYDFARKRLSVVIERDGRRLMITKGQLARVLEVCDRAELPDGRTVPLEERDEAIRTLHARLAGEGLRSLGVAVREAPADADTAPELERGLTFVGIVAFTDPPKADTPDVLRQLAALGIGLKVLTGDDHRVARHLWQTLHGRAPRVLVGPELRALGTEALQRRVDDVDVFAEVDPGQKERVVHALRRAGHVVAYLGDGINDAPALRAADVGLTVEGAADVAREAADIVLGSRDLGVVARGVREGRRTMANTLKYVYYTTSANFGNMLSMALASAFLPFLPLLPKQILANNFLSDIPAMTIAGDSVDADALARPGRWRTTEIRSFMFVFGTLSSVFDLLTFGVLLALSDSAPGPFRTGWFVESLLTELFVLLVMRTRRPFWRSRPSAGVLVSTLVVAAVALALPYVGPGHLLGLEPMPPLLLLVVVGITLAYVAATEACKHWFFRKIR